jgi:hypothetical protein
MKPDIHDQVQGDGVQPADDDRDKAEAMDDLMRDMMQAAEALPLPDHLLELLDDLAAEKPPSPARRLRR